MATDFLVHLIRRAFENLQEFAEEEISSKVAFVLGAPGSGKTSFSYEFMSANKKDGSVAVAEIGGALREEVLTNPRVFEVQFEIANLFLEASNMVSILSNHYSERELIVIDGGIIQSYVHLWNRDRNVDEKLRRNISYIYNEFMGKLFTRLQKKQMEKSESTLTFILLEHRDRTVENRVFEESIRKCLKYIDGSGECLSIELKIFCHSCVTEMFNDLSLFSTFDPFLR